MGLGFGRIVLRAALIAVTISVPLVTSSAPRTKVLAPHEPIAPRVPKDKELPLPSAKLGSVVGGPWMVDANFKSAIYIKNVVEVYPVTVTPILYLSNGARYALPELKIEPAGTAVVDVNAALDSLGLASYATLSGYMELQYNFPWHPICAFIRNVDTVHSMIFLQSVQVLPTELLEGASSQPATKQQALEGMWWKQEPNVAGFVTLSNTSARPIAASVETSDSAGKTFAVHDVTVSAHGTKIIQMTELPAASQNEGGVRVTYAGPHDALIANGGLQDPSAGYSANMRFLASQGSPKVSPLSEVELGLMTGIADPMMSFPAGTKFTPYSLLRNTSSQPATVTPTLWWMQAGSAQSFQLPGITLQPYRTQRLDVPAMLAAAGLKNFNGSFNINFDIQGVYGAILQAAGSVDQTNTYVFEVNARGIGVSGSRSMPYWSTGNGDDTMVTIWNPADEAQDFILKLFFTGGQYGLPVHLGARATQTLNISEIIQNQVPDAEGNIVPASVHNGSLVITGSLAENQLILFAADLGIYNVRKAICGAPTCVTCNGVTSTAVAANPFTVPVSGQTQLNFTLTWNTGSQYNYTNSSNWSSNNTGIATVQTGLTHGVSVGSATVSAQVTSSVPEYVQSICSESGSPVCPQGNNGASSPGCVGVCITSISPAQGLVGVDTTVKITGMNFASGATIQAGPSITVKNISVNSSTQITATLTPQNSSDSGGSWNLSVTSGGQTSNSSTFFVQIPTSLKVISVSLIANGATGGCASTDYGIRIAVNYQVMDQTPSAISSSSMVPQEFVNGVGPGNIVPNTNADGTYVDMPIGTCAQKVFTISETQAVQIAISSNAYSVRTNNFTITGTSAGHGSITNGSDISKTR